MERRTFLKESMAMAVSGMALNSMAFGTVQEGKKSQIALQVYSVRQAAAKDLQDTLKKIATAGYPAVEFAGYYNHEAKEIRKMLDDLGLKAISTHLGLHQLLCDEFDKTVEFEKILGNKNLVVAGGFADSSSFDAGNRMLANLFNELSIKAEKVGMKVGFHAHSGDFTRFKNDTAWNHLVARTRKEVIAEMDIGNCLSCGADPYEAIEKAPGRSELLHMKSFGTVAATLIGDPDDKVDWKRIHKAGHGKGGTQWYIIEQEAFAANMPPMKAIEICIKNLRDLGF